MRSGTLPGGCTHRAGSPTYQGWEEHMTGLRMFGCVVFIGSLAAGFAAPSQSDALAIADFNDGTLRAKSGLGVWPYTDEQFGGTSEARVSIIRPGAKSSSGTLHVVFRVTNDSPMPFAGVWAFVAKDGQSADLSTYR